MATVDQAFLTIRKKVDAVFIESLSKTNLTPIAKAALEQVVDRTRKGRGAFGGKQTKLKGLEKSYKDQRAGKIAFYTDKNGNLRAFKPDGKPKNLSNKTSPGKSNATATGQMLESIKFKVRFGQIKLFPSGKRRKELHKNSSSKTNKEVLKYYDDERPFFSLTDAERNKMARLIRKQMTKRLKSQNI